jgi:hypothetical protein
MHALAASLYDGAHRRWAEWSRLRTEAPRKRGDASFGE